MAMNSLKPISSILFLLALVTAKTALASDPDILSDFIAPTNTSVDGKFFNYTGMRGVLAKFPQNFTLTKATMNEFPALNGQSVSYAVLQYTADGPNPPRTHPRAAELLFLVYGCLEVGFVDTKNVFYTQSLQVGDMFIFPKGLGTINTTQPKNRQLRFLLLVVQMLEQFLCLCLSFQLESMMVFLPRHSRLIYIPFRRSSLALAS